MLTRALIRLLLLVMFRRRERVALLHIVRSVAADPRMSIIEPTKRFGREYRRDEAAYRAVSMLALPQHRANLGVELSYHLIKSASKPHKHESRLS